MGDSKRRLPRTVETLERGIEEGLHLGGQLCVELGGQPVADLALGEAEPGRALTRDHLMLWMSTSKPVGAVAVAQLWERGRLTLDDPIALHVPEFADQGKGGITLRHALTHTGGFRTLDLGWTGATWDETIAKICALRPEPRWAPGERAGYHTESSWFMLGEVVRRIDGRPFERYVRDEIFEPLEMDDCWIGMPKRQYEAYGERIAPVFQTGGEAPRRLPTTSEAALTRTNPAGNGCGPIHQLARLYRARSAGGELDGRRILSPQTVEALTSRHRVNMEDRTFRAKLDWGLGFILDSKHYGEDNLPYGYGHFASKRAYGHSGRLSSTAFADPQHGLVVALAVNGAPAEANHRRRFQDLLDAVYLDLELGGS